MLLVGTAPLRGGPSRDPIETLREEMLLVSLDFLPAWFRGAKSMHTSARTAPNSRRTPVPDGGLRLYVLAFELRWSHWSTSSSIQRCHLVAFAIGLTLARLGDSAQGTFWLGEIRR